MFKVFHLPTTPEEFVSNIKWFLGGPCSLAFFPGLVIGLIGLLQHSFCSLLIDPNDDNPLQPGDLCIEFPFLPYLTIFILGYLVAAADQTFSNTVMKRHKLAYFLLGLCLCLTYALLDGVAGFNEGRKGTILVTILRLFLPLLRGVGQWLFILGTVAIARDTITVATGGWVRTLRELSMPFYLIHEQVLYFT